MGCSHDNPGFQVKGSADGSGASETSVSASGVTSETSVSSTPTTGTPDTTTSGPGTAATGTSEPGTSGSSGSSDPSTGGLLPWDNNCNAPVPSKPLLAAADAYFFHSYSAGEGSCVFTDKPLSPDFECVDLNAGKDDYLPMVFADLGTPEANLQALFGVRFSLDGLEDGGEPVPRGAVVDATMELYFFRGNSDAPWDPPEFDLYALEAANKEVVLWDEGDHFGPGGCSQGEPSFRCLACGASPEGPCDLGWSVPESVYYPEKSKLLQHFDLGAPVPKAGLMHPVDLDLPATNHALDTGVLVVLTTGLSWLDALELKSRNYDQGSVGPFLTVRYCPNPNAN